MSTRKIGVVKRDGALVPLDVDEIHKRVLALGTCSFEAGPPLDITNRQVDALVRRVVNGLYDGVTTREIDELLAQTAAALVTENIDFGTLAARVAISNLQRRT